MHPVTLSQARSLDTAGRRGSLGKKISETAEQLAANQTRSHVDKIWPEVQNGPVDHLELAPDVLRGKLSAQP